MLDDFKDGQDIVYNILKNGLDNDKLSHAYLFDSSYNSDVLKIVNTFTKEIILKDTKDEDKIIIEERIDSGNYIDIKVIEPDGLWIKKDQMLNLQEEFSKVAIEGNKKIYIIKSAERMNVQTANSILKFLEEPIDNIIAILITDNINQIMPTIISRCQIIKLKKKEYSNSSLDNFKEIFYAKNVSSLKNEDICSIIDNVFKFISFFEKNHLDTIIYSKELWHNKFKTRDDVIMALELLINFYYDVIKYKSNIDNLFYKDRIEDLKMIANKNEIDILLNKINSLDNALYGVKRNLNMNLILDRMIIDMCGD